MSEPAKPVQVQGGVYFCEVTGKRIVAPGVCKEVDPKHGQDLYKEKPEKPARHTREDK